MRTLFSLSERGTAPQQVQPEIGSEKAFGQALRESGRRREISEEQLGLDAGFDRTYINLIERDKQPDDLDRGKGRGSAGG